MALSETFRNLNTKVSSRRHLLVLPASMMFFYLQGIKLFYSGIPDPFLYLGYAIDYQGMQSRWGGTYYASRLSVIPLLWVREKIGIDIYLWHLMLLAVVVTLIFYFLRQLGTSDSLSFIIALIVVNVPWNFRHFSDDYVYSYATIYALVFIIGIINGTRLDNSISQRNAFITAGIAAVALFIAHQSYFISIVPAVFVVLAFAYLSGRRRLTQFRFFVFGVIFASIFIIFLQIRLSGYVGLRNFWRIIKNAIQLSGDNGAIWTYPLAITSPIIILIFGISLISLACHKKTVQAILKRVSTFDTNYLIVTLAIASLSSISFGIFVHNEISGAILSSTTYSYIFSPTVLLLSAVFLTKINRKFASALLMSQFFSNLALKALPQYEFSLYINTVLRVMILALVVVTFFVCIFPNSEKKSRKTLRFAPFTVVILLFCMPLLVDNQPFLFSKSTTQSVGEYRQFYKQSNTAEEVDKQYLARDFAKFVKKNIPSSHFSWTVYPKDPTYLMALDSTQLWGYSCFKCVNPAGYPIERPYPPSEQDIPELRKRNGIILFDVNKEKFDDAKSRILGLDSNYRVTAQTNLKANSGGVYVAIIDMGMPIN